MSADQNVAHLHAPIRAILTAPGVDLSSISAKRVRRQLVDDGHADSALVKTHKAALDALIGEVFSEVNVGNAGGGGDGGESEANGEDGYGEGAETQEDGGDTDGVDGDEEARDEEEEERPVKKERKPAGKKRKAVEDDEAVARALHAQINGGRPSRAAAPPAKKRAKKTKSAETVDGEDAPKKKRGGGGGFQKPYHLSEPLAAVVGTDTAPRPTVVKLLWEHIKGRDLQNPSDKREIMCDEALRAVFGKDKVTMFSMNKELSAHLTPVEKE